MKAYHLQLPVNLQVKYDLKSDGFDAPIETLINSGECVAIMAVLTEGIFEEPERVVCDIMDFCYMKGRFEDSPDSDHADVWVKLTDRHGNLYEVDLDQFSDVEQFEIAWALAGLLAVDHA